MLANRLIASKLSQAARTSFSYRPLDVAPKLAEKKRRQFLHLKPKPSDPLALKVAKTTIRIYKALFAPDSKCPHAPGENCSSGFLALLQERRLVDAIIFRMLCKVGNRKELVEALVEARKFSMLVAYENARYSLIGRAARAYECISAESTHLRFAFEYWKNASRMEFAFAVAEPFGRYDTETGLLEDAQNGKFGFHISLFGLFGTPRRGATGEEIAKKVVKGYVGTGKVIVKVGGKVARGAAPVITDGARGVKQGVTNLAAATKKTVASANETAKLVSNTNCRTGTC